MSTERALTVDEFERIAPFIDGRSELVDGRLRIMSPTGFLHGILSVRIGAALDRYLDEHPDMGEVAGAETGFRVDSPRRPVLAPDAAFVRADRLPETPEGPVKRDDPIVRFMVGPPDVAVEVRSPDDSANEMAEKARDWLAAGAREVWLVDGQHETVRVLRDGQQPIVLTKNDTLTAPDVLPDFSLLLADLFARRRRSAHARP